MLLDGKFNVSMYPGAALCKIGSSIEGGKI
jgi:hypothetical protein